MSAKIICCGIAVLDRVYELTTLPCRPGKITARGYRETGGGMAATAAIAIAHLGGAASWCGRLGQDGPGATLLALFGRHGVATDGVTVTAGAQTPTACILVDAVGESILAVFPGAGLPEDAPLHAGLLDRAGAVLADPRWVAGAEALFARAAARGIPRVLDADIVPRDALRRLALQADHVVFSQRGLVEFCGVEAPQEGLAAAAATLGGTIAVTLGEFGSLWWRDGAAHHLPAPRITARDTTGCGDVFHGAYTLALAEGASVPYAARFATAAAALKAMRGEGWDGMPDRAAVLALMQEDW